MARKRSRPADEGSAGEEGPTGVVYPPAERELIVVADPDARLRATDDGVSSLTGADTASLNDFLAAEGIALEPLFGISEDHLQYNAAWLSSQDAQPVPDLTLYYRVDAEDKRLEPLAPELAALPGVIGAYVKPAPEPASATDVGARAGRAESAAQEAAATADFSARQGYLGAAPEGVDALWAHTQAGGAGSGVQIIDVEGAWQLSHQDLLQNIGGVIAGTPITDLAWRNHGTAVFGEFGGDRNA
jgi:hypothetical protein